MVCIQKRNKIRYRKEEGRKERAKDKGRKEKGGRKSKG